MPNVHALYSYCIKNEMKIPVDLPESLLPKRQVMDGGSITESTEVVE